MITLILPLMLEAGGRYVCDYNFMGAPTASVEVLVDADGTPAPSVEITMSGRKHKETATPETRGAGETVHLWISKENPENAIEMIVFQDNTSKLINHNVPIGKEMPGACQVTTNPED